MSSERVARPEFFDFFLPFHLATLASCRQESVVTVRDEGMMSETLPEGDRRAKGRERALEQALADRARFISRLSQEMRSPLHAIQGLADLLADSDSLNPTEQRQVESIGREANALRRMIDDLIDMSKIGTGHLDLLSEPFAPAALCDEIGRAHREAAELKGLTLKVEIGDDVPSIVIGDRHRVRQILVNLVSNAIKYTDSGFVSLKLVAGERDDESTVNPVRFIVQDSGRGIPQEQAPLLFEPYRQLHVSDSGVGTGIGLTITRMLVEIMGGSIWLTSNKAGTTFTCEIPLREGRRESDYEAVAREQALESNVSGDATILVVDDSEVNLLVASGQLKRLGYEPVLVASGKAALDQITSNSFDLVLMDIHMPVMDGLEAAQLIRAMGDSISQPRIVAMAASVEEDDQEKFERGGLDDYLIKPASMSDLSQVLSRWFGDPDASGQSVDRVGGVPGQPSQLAGSTAVEETSTPRSDHGESEPAPVDGQGSGGVISTGAIEALIVRTGGSREAKAHVRAFLVEMKTWRRHLTDAVATDHLDAARRTAEAVSSAARDVGASQLASICDVFVGAAIEGSDAKNLLKDVLEACNQARDELTELTDAWDQESGRAAA